MNRIEPSSINIIVFGSVSPFLSYFLVNFNNPEATQEGAKELGQNGKNDDLVVSQKALLDTFGEISRTSINDFR
jgi:hypothetical protein